VATTHVEVDVALPRAGNLVLQYFVNGKTSDLRIPPVAAPTRADELWQHTCFEAFVCAPPAEAYYEFHFAPSTQWAAYRFTGYRRAMNVASGIGAPRVEIQSNPDCYAMEVMLRMDDLPDLPSHARWRLGLSTVLEDANGEKSYWALAHPPGKPDFHHSDCFAYELPATDIP
jgi:hypothetical protein